jgi:hypothetical protein
MMAAPLSAADAQISSMFTSFIICASAIRREVLAKSYSS